MFHVPNNYRLYNGKCASDDSYGNNGAFIIPVRDNPKDSYMIIASDGMGWEHVSVHVQVSKYKTGRLVYDHDETPSWEEMCYIKGLFWDEDDLVVQYHPKKSDYVNNHENTLHLWRATGQEIIAPPIFLV